MTATRKSLSRHELISLWLYAGFYASGVTLVLPGVLLPVFAAHWHLSDQRAGAVLLCASASAALGALVSAHSFRLTIILASLAVALGGVLWAVTATAPELPALLWGLGLGMLMTSISLLYQQQFSSTAGMVRLNFLWALGAFCCAPLIAPALHTGRPLRVLLVVAAAALIYAIGTVFLLSSSIHTQASRPFLSDFNLKAALRGIPPTLLLATACTVGIEGACGGWLSTYAARQHAGIFGLVAAPGCLWIGLLAGRGLGWLPGASARLSRTLPFHMGLVVAAVVVMVVAQSSTLLLPAAAVAGFGLGPLYPVLLTATLRRRPSGVVFLCAGLAASLFPWITGTLSTMAHSLRIGFLAVLGASLLLAILLARLKPMLRNPTTPEPLSTAVLGATP